MVGQGGALSPRAAEPGRSAQDRLFSSARRLAAWAVEILDIGSVVAGKTAAAELVRRQGRRGEGAGAHEWHLQSQPLAVECADVPSLVRYLVWTAGTARAISPRRRGPP